MKGLCDCEARKPDKHFLKSSLSHLLMSLPWSEKKVGTSLYSRRKGTLDDARKVLIL